MSDLKPITSWKFAIRQLIQRRSRLAIQWFMIVIGLALVSAFYTVEKSTNDQMVNDLGGIDQIWCAKGSPLQGLLANVYHIDNPLGNISSADVDSAAQSPLIERITRLAYGDTYKGRRILGADSSWYKLYNLQLKEGSWPNHAMEVVLSASLAQELQLQMGADFQGNHGSDHAGHVHHESYTVVGVYEDTRTVADRLVLTPLESVWDVHHDENRDITAALIETNSPMALFQLPRKINEETTFQAVLPSIEVNRIYALLGNTQRAFYVLSGLFLLLGGLSIGITIHETIRSQQFDHTLLRIFGLSPSRLALVVWLQTSTLLLSAWFMGLFLVKSSFSFLSNTLSLEFGLQVQWHVIEAIDLKLGLIAIAIGTVIIIPSLVRIFRTSIHKNLNNA